MQRSFSNKDIMFFKSFSSYQPYSSAIFVRSFKLFLFFFLRYRVSNMKNISWAISDLSHPKKPKPKNSLWTWKARSFPAIALCIRIRPRPPVNHKTSARYGLYSPHYIGPFINCGGYRTLILLHNGLFRRINNSKIKKLTFPMLFPREPP